MNPIDLRKVDLNLLVVLDVLLRERNVTQAAHQLHRTQSAISHSLGRLRETLGDPLLVRVGGDMKATPFAQALAPELARMLDAIQRVLQPPGGFAPQSSERAFVVAAPDFAAGLMPAVYRAVAAAAPHASLEWKAPGPRMLLELADGKWDLALAPSWSLPVSGVASAGLGEIDWAVFARRGHPAVRGWSARQWREASHLMVRIGSDIEAPVSSALRDQGAQRRVGAYVPSFSAVAPMLAQSDLLATLPRLMMAGSAAAFDLVALESPIAVPPMAHSLCWGLRTSRDPGVEWLREIVSTAFAQAMRAARQLKVKPLTKRR